MNLNELVAKWRKPKPHAPWSDFEVGYKAALSNCTDELEAALQQQGEAVATVCLVGERYAHGSMVEVQLQLASEDAPTPKIGDRYYTHPSKPVVSDREVAVIGNFRRLATHLEGYIAPEDSAELHAHIERLATALGVKS